jgi:hypothetical protein
VATIQQAALGWWLGEGGTMGQMLWGGHWGGWVGVLDMLTSACQVPGVWPVRRHIAGFRCMKP